jgi:hypothetical protein
MNVPGAKIRDLSNGPRTQNGDFLEKIPIILIRFQ